LVSLACGFFGVTGLGIVLLSIRVGYGVLTGELDPTPIQPKSSTSSKDQPTLDISNAWDMMLNKKPRSSSRRGKNKDSNPFGF
jgi:hypothetical protein